MHRLIGTISLRNKIIASSLLPTALILVAVAFFAFSAYQQVAEDLVIQRDQELVRLSASQLARELESYAAELDTLARTADMYHGDAATQQNALGSAARRLAVFDAGVIVLDSQGNVKAAHPSRPEIIGQDWSGRDYFRQVVRTRRPAFSNILADGSEGVEVIALGVPILGEQGQLVGAVAGMFRLGNPSVSAFYGGIVRQRIGQGGDTYLVDGRGRVIFHSDFGRIGEDFSRHPIVRKVLTGQMGAERTSDSQGNAIVAGYAPLPETNWGLVTEESWEQLTQSSLGYRRLLFLLLALGVVAPSLIVGLMVRHVTKPISDLTGAARELAGGRFGTIDTPRTGDEIEELANQFNTMSAQLQASYANLEERVAARTREVTTLLEVSRNVVATLDLQPLLGMILDQMKAVVDYTGAAVMVLHGDQVRVLAYRGPIPEWDTSHLSFPLSTAGVNREVIRRRAPVVISDVWGDSPLAREFQVSAGDKLNSIYSYIRCWMGIPLVVKDRVIGMLSFDHRTPGFYGPAHAELALAFSAQAAVAIANAQLYEEVRRRADEIQTLYTVQQAIASPLEWDLVLQLIADEARRLTGTRISLVYLRENGELRRAVVSGEEVPRDYSGHSLPIDHSSGGLAFRTGQPVLIQDARSDPRANPQLVNESGVRSLLAVPLIHNEPIGVILVGDKNEGQLGPDDERVLSILAQGAVIQLDNARLFREEQTQRQDAERRRRVAEGLRDILAVLNSSQPLEEILATIIEQAGRLIGVDAGVIYRIDHPDKRVAVEASAGMPPEFSQLCVLPWVDTRTNVAILSGSPHAVPDFRGLVEAERATIAQMPPEVQQWVQIVHDHFGAYLSVPLVIKGQVYGDISLYYKSAHQFTEEEIHLAILFADQAALAIENARLFAQAERRMYELEALYRADEELYRHLELYELLQALADVAVDQLKADKSIFLVWDAGQQALVVGAARGFSQDSLEKMVFLPGDGIIGEVVTTGEPAVVEDVSTDSRHLTRITGPEGIRSFIHIPIMIAGEIFGVFNLSYTQPRGFLPEEQRLFLALAHRAATAIENAQLYERAGRAATLEERQRLARELHDAVTQTLFSASLIAEVLPRIWAKNADAGQQRLEELRQLTRGALAEMRTLLLELRPAALVESEMDDLLRQLGEATTGRSRIPVIVSAEKECPLPADVKVALYRISQESLNNIVKHAGAGQAWISLRCDDEGVHLTIEDNGKGFETQIARPDRLGLGIMKERAESIGARLTIESEAGEGTIVHVSWNPPSLAERE